MKSPQTAAPTSPPDCNGDSRPPCFYWPQCKERAALAKAGRSVCRACAANLRGVEYPLRDPSAEPPYLSAEDAAQSLDMIEGDRRSHPRRTSPRLTERRDA